MISKEKIKYIRSLHHKKYRDKNKQFIIEGPKMIEEAIRYVPEKITCIYGISLSFASPLKTVNYETVKPRELAQLSALKNPQQVIAICDYLDNEPEATDFYIALDGIQNPGNLGTILRIAAWFGIPSVMASMETVDRYNPKVVQASMGAIFTVTMIYGDLLEELSTTDLPVYGTFMEGNNIYKKELKRKGIVLIGNEGKGISEALHPFVDHRITIPKWGNGESLNAAVATAIVVSEFSRTL